MFKRNLQMIKNGSAFHTCCLLNGKSAKVFNKVMTGKKKKYFQSVEPTLPNTSYVSEKTSMVNKITGNPRRCLVLNKLFMKHITDLMATGEYSSQILGHGIEVNKVSITQDYRILRVYWIAKNTVDYDSIENILMLNSGFLRNELSQLRLMGEVPKIVFVKDKSYWKVAEVEKLLSKADFGEDYVKPKIAEKFGSFELWTSLNSDVKNKLEKLECTLENTVEGDLREIPPMPQNVLGLDHADILKNIKKRTLTSKAEHRNDSSTENIWAQWNEFKINQPVNSDPVRYGSQQEQRQAFKDFWQQRQLVKMKIHKTDKNWNPEVVLNNDKKHEYLENADLSKELYVDDYISEEFEEYEK